MKQVVETCHRFVDDFSTEHGNLLFTGPTGVGKTFLTNCIARELIDRYYSVIYLSANDLFEVFFRYLLPGGDLLQGDEPLVVIHRQIRHQPQAIAAFGGYFHVRKPPLFLYKKPSCRIYYGADILSIPQNSGKLNCK